MTREQDLNAALLGGMSTFENGCDFKLRFDGGGRVFLRYGCYGVHVNLAQGPRRALMDWLGVIGGRAGTRRRASANLDGIEVSPPVPSVRGFRFRDHVVMTSSKPSIARTGMDPLPWIVVLPHVGATPPKMAMCATFAQTLQVLDAFLRYYRQASALRPFLAWQPHGAALN